MLVCDVVSCPSDRIRCLGGAVFRDCCLCLVSPYLCYFYLIFGRIIPIYFILSNESKMWGQINKTKTVGILWLQPSGHATLSQRRINVNATSGRCINVDTTLHKCHVPAGRMPYLESYFRRIQLDILMKRPFDQISIAFHVSFIFFFFFFFFFFVSHTKLV